MVRRSERCGRCIGDRVAEETDPVGAGRIPSGESGLLEREGRCGVAGLSQVDHAQQVRGLPRGSSEDQEPKRPSPIVHVPHGVMMVEWVLQNVRETQAPSTDCARGVTRISLLKLVENATEPFWRTARRGSHRGGTPCEESGCSARFKWEAVGVLEHDRTGPGCSATRFRR